MDSGEFGTDDIEFIGDGIGVDLEFFGDIDVAPEFRIFKKEDFLLSIGEVEGIHEVIEFIHGSDTDNVFRVHGFDLTSWLW